MLYLILISRNTLLSISINLVYKATIVSEKEQIFSEQYFEILKFK